MAESVIEHELVARNAATQSENRIHDDEIARRHGFAGGLVPGVTLYAYLTRPVVQEWGRSWLERGVMSVRFVHPVYDGDLVAARGTPEPPTPGAGDAMTLALLDSSGTECVRGRAALPAQVAEAPDPADFGVADIPVPDRRPPADEESLAPGRVLGTLYSRVGEGRSRHAAAYTALFAGDLPIYAEEGLAHPGELILAANAVLSGSVALGPWIHVGSEVVNLAPVPLGATVETRAKVVDRFTRGERRFVVLDVLWLVEDKPTTRATHTAIYRL